MKTGTRYSAFAFISALVLSIVAISPPARAVSVGFDQVSWAANGGYQDQNSQWGQADISFSPTDAGSFSTDISGGYYTFVNIVTTVGGGLANNWAVQNMPIYYNSLSDLNGSLPLGVNFDLGQADGTSVTDLQYSITFSSTALSLQPSGSMTDVPVSSDTETAGNEDDPNSTGNEAELPASNYSGAPGSAAVRRGGNIATSQNNVPTVLEATNNCAPGAAARSIRYLGNMFPSLNVTQSAQGIYGVLSNNMNTSQTRGTTMVGSLGPTNSPFANGKNAYFASNNLAIGPTTFLSGNGSLNYQGAMSSLNATSDLEVWLSWGYTNRVQGSTNFAVYLGGHAAFVTGITPIYGGPGGTNIIQYNITYINDPDQGASTNRNNEADSLVVFPNGGTTQFGTNVLSAGVFGFFVETAVPEPSSLAMAVLGLGVLGLAITFRKPKRSRT